MTDQSTPPAFVVTQQAEVTDLGPAGNYVSGIRITFRTARNAIGSVFLPHDSYTVQAAGDAIRAKAAALDAVADLTS